MRKNKATTGLIMLLVIIGACQFDRFADTRPRIYLDKNEYRIGEEFNIKLIISSESKEEIRFYNDFRNLNLWFRNRYICENGFNGRCNGNLQETKLKNRKKRGKSKYVISKNKPFEKKIKCKITKEGDAVIIIIDELNQKVKIPKDLIKRGDKIGLSGICIPIKAHPFDPIEDHLNLVEFDIILN